MQLSILQELILAEALKRGSVTIKSLMRDLSSDFACTDRALRGLRAGGLTTTDGQRRDGCTILFLSEAGRQRVLEASSIVPSSTAL